MSYPLADLDLCDLLLELFADNPEACRKISEARTRAIDAQWQEDMGDDL